MPGLALARVLAGAVMATSILVLGGWAFGQPALRSVGPGLIPMMPLTAVGLLLVAGAIGLLAGGRVEGARRVGGLGAAALAAAIGAATLVAYLLGRDLGLDRLLFPREVVAAWPDLPGRPAPTTALVLLVLGTALTGLPRARHDRLVAAGVQTAALACAALVYLVLLGYAYDITAFYAWVRGSPMALHTAGTLMAASLATIAATPRASLPALLAARGAAGRSMRRLLAPTILGPVLLGGLRLQAEREGLIPGSVGLEIMVLVLALAGFGLLWWSAARFRRAEAELIDLYDKAPCGYHSLDAEGRVVRINETELAWLGRPREEVLGRHWARTFLTDASQSTFAATFPVFKARGWIKDVPFELRRADGTPMPVLGSATAIRDEEDRFVMSNSTIYDMTARRALEEAVARSEARLQAVIEAAPDALMLVDGGYHVVYANAEAATVFGYPAEALKGLDMDALVPPEDRARDHEARARFVPPAGPVTMGGDHLRGLRRDGSTFPVEVRLSPVAVPEGRLLVVSLRDLTERQRMQAEAARREIEAEQARELARVKDYLLSTISHEMKTPVALITGYAELLEDKYPDEDIVAGLVDGANRLATHTNRIVDLGALLGGAMPLYRSEIELLELVEAAHRMVAGDVERAGVRWRAWIAPDLPPLHGDLHRLAQALAELLANACRFTPAGGEVGVRVEDGDGVVALTVWDTGPGISPVQLARAWDAFNQVRTADALRPGGLGLGLALVKGIVDLHGGHVAIASPPGGGTQVRVELPITGKAPADRHPGGEAGQEV